MRALALALLTLPLTATSAHATTLPLQKAEHAVRAEFLNRHQQQPDAVFCHHATARHIRCVTRITLAGCNEDWLWGATLTWNRNVYLAERDNARVHGACPTVTATPVSGTVTVTP